MGAAEATLPTPGHQKVFGLVWRTVREALFLLEVGTLCVLALFVRKGVCRSEASMEGKTVIVTGANAGIGKATAMDLAKRKARVILACRNMERAKRAAQEIFDATGQVAVVKQLDLASFKSVNDFCDDILKTESRLDVLINNAGIVTESKGIKLTEDGYELCYQSNYLSHYLLTMRLLGVTVNALHPGDVKTNIATNSPGGLFFGFLLALAGKTAEEGAQTSIYLAVEPKMSKETGRYYSDCQRAWISRQAADRRRCERFFWDSARLVRLDEAEVKALVEK
ncbi:retinol dehydrogenase 13-like isoform X3 [Dermacentor andersoni]|uniref:retinol dehydrogenase 13-like isoform X3 n=1 Tax=Dermacentor andersoni TaxID=34620 RepID=UPI002417E0BA|nr:retinol dehydrogenase 13-like isoform X3 [Dermacentor andersoni]